MSKHQRHTACIYSILFAAGTAQNSFRIIQVLILTPSLQLAHSIVSAFCTVTLNILVNTIRKGRDNRLNACNFIFLHCI